MVNRDPNGINAHLGVCRKCIAILNINFSLLIVYLFLYFVFQYIVYTNTNSSHKQWGSEQALGCSSFRHGIWYAFNVGIKYILIVLALIYAIYVYSRNIQMYKIYLYEYRNSRKLNLFPAFADLLRSECKYIFICTDNVRLLCLLVPGILERHKVQNNYANFT